jgi:hypothetical protein
MKRLTSAAFQLAVDNTDICKSLMDNMETWNKAADLEKLGNEVVVLIITSAPFLEVQGFLACMWYVNGMNL